MYGAAATRAERSAVVFTTRTEAAKFLQPYIRGHCARSRLRQWQDNGGRSSAFLPPTGVNQRAAPRAAEDKEARSAVLATRSLATKPWGEWSSYSLSLEPMLPLRIDGGAVVAGVIPAEAEQEQSGEDGGEFREQLPLAVAVERGIVAPLIRQCALVERAVVALLKASEPTGLPSLDES